MSSTNNRKRLKSQRIKSSSLKANSKLYSKSSSSSSSSVNTIEIYRIVMRDGFQYFEIE
ncbi:MAG TPA: hypothetical protein VE244_01775 [Nitrososphaeraceae archaeon]|nr:hypothetical protein [Nitrososphaeraceae archaeon]